MKQDEREIIAEEFFYMYQRIHERAEYGNGEAITDGYIDYIVFCMTGSHILKGDKLTFLAYVEGIMKKSSEMKKRTKKRKARK